MSKPVRYTDTHKYPLPYADAKASSEPNYLRDKFAAIREQQAKDEAERATKVKAMRGRK